MSSGPTGETAKSTAVRTASLATTLSAVFVILIQHSSVAKITFFGIVIKNRYLVLSVIPPVVAYLGYVVAHNVALATWFRVVHDAAVKYLWPGFTSEKLELTLRPANSYRSYEALTTAIDTKAIKYSIRGTGGLLMYALLFLARSFFRSTPR